MTTAINHVAFGNGIYVRVGLQGLIQRSVDAESWDPISSGTINDLWGVVFGSNLFVAVGDSGTVLYSDDNGVTWSPRVSNTSNHLYAVTYGDGIWIAVGANGTVLISLDAEEWAAFDSDDLTTTVSLRDVSFGAGYITVAGDDGFLQTAAFSTTDKTPTIEENVLASGAWGSVGTFNHTASDEIGMREWTYDPLSGADFESVVVESLRLSMNNETTFGASITRTEGLALLDRPFINNETLSEALSLDEVLSAALGFSVLESILMDESLMATMLFRNTVMDAVDIAGTYTDSMLVAVTISDAAGMDDSPSSTMSMAQLVSEGVTLGLGLNLEDEAYKGLVLNTRNLALTKYSGYNFNSFARIGDKYYGAADDGIYLLEGDDDNGTDIEAHLRTAIFDFNSDFQKRVPRAYLGLRGDGEVYLKAITNEEEVHWYRIQDVQEKFENNRVRMGRGVTSEYWQFELANVDGSFFELHDMTLIPVVLTRRVK